jgi:hypothetical protein
MQLYASGTTVPVEKTRMELDRLLQKHGAIQRGILSDDEGGRATVLFALADRKVELQVPLPKPSEFAVGVVRGRKSKLAPEQQRKLWEQACRQRWRCMLLIVRAKLELIELKMSTVEREFLADIVLPGGKHVSSVMTRVLEEAYRTGKMPQLGAGSPP